MNTKNSYSTDNTVMMNVNDIRSLSKLFTTISSVIHIKIYI